MPARVPSLTLRELNRALLARQFLLTRQKIGVVDAVERLACLQGQWAPSPYVALWSRLSVFDRAQLAAPIDRGEIVKATLMRATLHLVSAREYPAYSLATMEGRFGAWRPPGAPALADLEVLHKRVMTFAAKTPRTRGEIEEFTAAHLPPSAKTNERLRSWLKWAAVAPSAPGSCRRRSASRSSSRRRCGRRTWSTASWPVDGRSRCGRRRRYSSSGHSSRSPGSIAQPSSRRARSSCVSMRPSPRTTACGHDEERRPAPCPQSSGAEPRDAGATAASGASEHRCRAGDRAACGVAGAVVPLSIHRALVTPRGLPSRKALVGDRTA